jgi:membrane fusion protein, multidrug efflux system
MKSALMLGIAGILASLPAAAGVLATYTASAQADGACFAATGTVEAVRQGTLGSQVSGRIAEVSVRTGDQVRAGQPLIRIEAGDSADAAAASAAAASGAAARLASARADFERAQRLRAQDYISVAAMQRAEATLRSAEADAQASAAQAKAARTRASWHTVTAPYAGHVTQLWVSAGDMAAPGRPLLGMYDPTALRVVAQIPESLAARIEPGRSAQLQVGAAAPTALSAWRVIPAIDPVTHSVQVRAELPSASGLEPGQFVNLLLPLRSSGAEVRIPISAVLRRSEVIGVYVVDDHGAPHLRQVRLGPQSGNTVTVLAGLRSGERVALDPLAAGSR